MHAHIGQSLPLPHSGVRWAFENMSSLSSCLSCPPGVQLAAEFQVRFEAPHVINARTQVWAGSVAAGPDAQNLVATFEQSRRPAFQDSLGRSIAAIAGVVPDGLLVFFSSYSMMDRLKERWEVQPHLSIPTQSQSLYTRGPCRLQSIRINALLLLLPVI